MAKLEVDEKLVRHIAHLARLNLSENEVANYVTYMKQILSYVQTLDQVNTDQVSPLLSPVMHFENIFEENLNQKFQSREDTPVTFEGANALLNNAPSREEGQYKIQAVIEEE